MTGALKVLHIEDSEGDAALVARSLEKAGYELEVKRVDDAQDMSAALAARDWDVVLCDYRLPQFDASSALRILQEAGLDLPFIVVSGAVGEDVAVGLMKSGAHDYVMKDHLARLAPAVEREIREAHTRRAHRQAQEALRESEERFRRFYEISLAGIAIHDGVSLLDANEAFGTMFGYAPGEIIGKPPLDFIAPEAREFVAARIAEGSGEAYDMTGLRKDGSRFPVEFVARKAAHQGRPAWAVVTRDLSERQRTEERLREAQKFESVGLLAAGIAHDFNNILTSVSGSVSLALDSIPEDVQVHALLRSAIESTQRAAGLTRQLLAYAGKGAFVKEAVPVSKVADEVVQLLRRSAPPNVELRAELHGSVPPVMADPSQIQQVFMNLIQNGVEAIGKENRGVVLVRTGLRGDSVSLEVEDNGCGIEDAMQKRVFEPFFTTRFVGRGLGLAAVQGIVRSLQGTIALESALGKGTRVQVLLPVMQAVIAAHPAKVAKAVLIVHDDAGVRERMAAILDKRGIAHTSAASALEAFEMLESDGPEVGVVIFDEQASRPNENGALAAMRALRPNLNFIRRPETDEELLARLLPALSGGSQA
jgi:PAS domain S-box-containing protein